jgi:hypothetical protein
MIKADIEKIITAYENLMAELPVLLEQQQMHRGEICRIKPQELKKLIEILASLSNE